MSTHTLDALSRLASRRFGSFADAATSVLDLLEGAAPGASLALGQLDWDAGDCRIVDGRGDAAPRGTAIPLAHGVSAIGSGAAELLDSRTLAALSPAGWMAAPLDAADGRVVGVLLASGAGDGAARELAQLLLVGARLLSYEWESVSSRAELRRLAELARDRERTDPVTGLPNRAALLQELDREWQLSKRGTVESYLVVCHAREREALAARYGEAVANLLLKDAAEVLGGAVRRTDHLGRVSPQALGAVLVGCKGPEGALAFLSRFERGLERVGAGRPAKLELAYGIHPLADSESPEEALAAAELSAVSTPAKVEA